MAAGRQDPYILAASRMRSAEGQGKGMIRPRPHLEPKIGPFRQLRSTRIHHDEGGPLSELFKQKRADLPLLIAACHIAAPEHDKTALLVEIHDRIETAGVNARDFPGR